MKKLLLVLLLLFPINAFAATFHVVLGAGGNCTTAGNQSGAVGSIVGGIQCATYGAGDTIIIHAGTYHESWATNNQGIFPAGASTTQRTTVKAAPGETVIWMPQPGCVWDPPNPQQDHCAMDIYLRNSAEGFISFQNLIFDGGDKANPLGNVVIGDDGSNLDNNAHDVEFINCEWRNWKGEVAVYGRNHRFSGGSMHDGGDSSGFRHFIYPSTVDGLIIENMQFYNHGPGYALHFFHGDPVAGIGLPGIAYVNVIVRGNTFHDLGAGTITLGNDSNIQIYNNVFYRNAKSGLVVGHAGCSDGAQIWNNTFDQQDQTNAGEGTICMQCASNHHIANNIMWRVGGGADFPNNGSCGAASGQNNNLFSNGSDPLFVAPNATPPNYHITNTSSPARNAGASGGPATLDKDGASRVGQVDIGAYEIGGAIVTPVKATYFMHPTGTNTTDCVAARGTLAAPSSSPMPTFAAVFPCAAAESTFVLRGGVYNQSIDTGSIPLAGGTSWSAPMTIQAFPGETVTIQGGVNVMYLTNPTNDQFLLFDHIIFDGLGTSNNVVALNGVHDVHFQNCEIRNGIYHGFLLMQTQGVTLDTGFVHGTSAGPPLVGLSGTTNTYITKSTLSNGAGAGVALDTDSGGVANTNFWIERSIITINGGSGVDFFGGANMKIFNNLIHSNGSGIHLGGGENNTQLFYNTLWNNNTDCMTFFSGVTTGQSTNNICFASAVVNNSAGTGMNFTTNICSGPVGCNAVDPSFANTTPGNANFLHLNPVSPAITPVSPARNNGTPIPSLMSDFNGKARPDPPGGAVDIGAFEEAPIVTVVEPPPLNVKYYGASHFLTN